MSLTLYFRYILAYSRLIKTYLFFLRHIENPSIFRNVLFQPYSGISYILHIVFRQIQRYLELWLIYTRYISVIFNQIQNVRRNEAYLPTLRYISTYLSIFRILAQLDIFKDIKAYSEPMAYSSIFRAVVIFSQFQTVIKISSCISWTLFEQIQACLELWLLYARNVSLIFRDFHKVTHIEGYFLTLKFRYILDPGITCSKCKATLALQVRFLLSNNCSDLFGTFFIFVSKVNIQHFYLQDNILIITIAIIIAYRPRKHDTHASMPSTQRCYSCHPWKHATHPITSHTLAQIARHFTNSISNNFEEQISFEYCRQRVHQYL